MERCSSGSSTGRRASMTSSTVTGMLGGSGGRGAPSGISTTGIGRIPADGAVAHARRSSRRRSRRSPRPSATPPGGRSTSSSATAASRDDGDGRGHRGRGGRALRPPPQRRPPPPRQARRRRLRRGRHRPHRRRRRPAVEALPRHRARTWPSSCPVRQDELSSRCSAGRSSLLPGDAAEAMAEEVGLQYGQAMALAMGGTDPADAERARRRPGAALVPRRAPRRGRRAHRPRLRRPRRAPRRRPAHRVRPLPVRRRGHRAPGDLRRRPRPGARACSARSTATPTPPPRRAGRWATTSASPPSPAEPTAA